MTAKDWLPQNHRALFEKAVLTHDYLVAPGIRADFGFGADTPLGRKFDATYLPAFEEYHSAALAYFDIVNRTPGITVRFTTAETEFKKIFRWLYSGFLRTNPLVSNDDLVKMGLPKRSSGKHTHAPVATEAPNCYMDTSVPGRVIFYFYGKDQAGKKAKPAGQHGVELGWEISDVAPARWEDLRHSTFDTHAPLTLSFENDQRGKTLYFALRWENTRGEKGPWSTMASAIIP
ncbi:MAG: hypothetical protein LBU42_05915 [Prevotellaceae bacterium]|jgi:hypothetical protein|nr:hypothetical protein [Prevotellaceae bacterium]